MALLGGKACQKAEEWGWARPPHLFSPKHSCLLRHGHTSPSVLLTCETHFKIYYLIKNDVVSLLLCQLPSQVVLLPGLQYERESRLSGSRGWVAGWQFKAELQSFSETAIRPLHCSQRSETLQRVRVLLFLEGMGTSSPSVNFSPVCRTDPVDINPSVCLLKKKIPVINKLHVPAQKLSGYPGCHGWHVPSSSFKV